MNDIQDIKGKDIRGKGTRRGGLIPDPGRIAPHVDKDWRDDFIVELRLRDVPGDQIGDALMTVETHVVDSEESAQEAFGDAKGYAARIAEVAGRVRSSGVVTPAMVVGMVLGLAGMLLAARTFTSWLEGVPVAFTVGDVIGGVLLLALLAALMFTGVLRQLVERQWLALVVPPVLIGVFVGIFLLFAEPLLELPVVPAAIGALVLIVLRTVIAWNDEDGTDEITAPGTQPGNGIRARATTALVLPLMTLLLLGFTWVLHQVSG